MKFNRLHLILSILIIGSISQTLCLGGGRSPESLAIQIEQDQTPMLQDQDNNGRDSDDASADMPDALTITLTLQERLLTGVYPIATSFLAGAAPVVSSFAKPAIEEAKINAKAATAANTSKLKSWVKSITTHGLALSAGNVVFYYAAEYYGLPEVLRLTLIAGSQLNMHLGMAEKWARMVQRSALERKWASLGVHLRAAKNKAVSSIVGKNATE